jgi:hypothetical protein
VASHIGTRMGGGVGRGFHHYHRYGYGYAGGWDCSPYDLQYLQQWPYTCY